MTNAEAIEYIKKNCYGEWCEDDWREAMDMAIEALKCSETPKSSERTSETAQADHIADIGKKVDGDCISRQAAIDAMGKAKWAKERLMELPSAQPEPQKGHWIGSDGSYICSECNGSPIDFIDTMGISFDAYIGTLMNYCPNCGADMRGEKDG